MDTFPYLESLITEDGEYTTEFRVSLNGAGDRAITAENLEKSEHTDFNEDTTIIKAMWPVATYTAVKVGHSEKMKNHVLMPLRWKGWEKFCGFRRQQRKQMSGFLTKPEQRGNC